MKIVHDVAALRVERRGRIALVPTMGALHEGHLSLVRIARAAADCVVVSLFVNPKQFDRPEDLDAYPRDLDGDAEKLRAAGADLLYAPSIDAVYPDGFATTVSVAGLTERWEGVHRPGHFDGVTTVVSKLFGQCAPDVAVFGEKDWQQLAVIRRMTLDLDLPIEILAGPTIREADGLAMASRNLRLSPDLRRVAPRLKEEMEAIAAGAGIAEAMSRLVEDGFSSIDYLARVDAETLEPLAANRPGRVAAAAWLGDVRLIDNIPIA